MAKVTFQIEFPIVPKGRPRKGKHGFYTPKRTEACELAVRLTAIAQICESYPSFRPFSKQVRMVLLLSPGRGDLDNRVKTAMDSLNGVLYKDDRQIKEIHAKEVEGKISTVTIEEI